MASNVCSTTTVPCSVFAWKIFSNHIKSTIFSNWIHPIKTLGDVQSLCLSVSFVRAQLLPDPGAWFNIKMTSYQYRKSHCGDKTILRPSYLHNGISYTGKTASLYWIRAQERDCRMEDYYSGSPELLTYGRLLLEGSNSQQLLHSKSGGIEVCHVDFHFLSPILFLLRRCFRVANGLVN